MESIPSWHLYTEIPLPPIYCFVCVQVYVCAHVCVHMKARGQPQVSFPRGCSPWSGLALPGYGAGMSSVCHHTWLFFLDLGA